jgi:hypothetical protein
MFKQQESLGRINWASSIRNLLHRYGFGFVWLNQTLGDINVFCIVSNKYL